MSRYRKIEVRTWSDEGFRELSPIPPCGQGLWFYLLTGPHTGPIPGLFRAGRASMAEELDWDVEAFDEAFAEVSAQGMAKADFKARLVWLPEALKYNKPESPNVVRSWRVELDLLPECPLKREAIAMLRTVLETVGSSYVDAFDEVVLKTPKNTTSKGSVKASGKPSPKTMPNQEQEQEQEQEKKDMSAQSPDAPLDSSELKSAPKGSGTPADAKCARWLFGLILDNNPEAKHPNIETWARDIRLLRERDHRTHEAICDLFQWAQADDFWSPNILSPGKLREKWDQLTMQRARAAAPKASTAWWASLDAMQAKAAELGIPGPRPGENEFAFKARIQSAMERPAGAPPAQAPLPAAAPPPAPRSVKPAGLDLKALVGPAPTPKEVA